MSTDNYGVRSKTNNYGNCMTCGPIWRYEGFRCRTSSPEVQDRAWCRPIKVSLARVFPSCFRSPFLPFSWIICSQHFPQYVFAISRHHMPVSVQSSLSDLIGRLRHSCMQVLVDQVLSPSLAPVVGKERCGLCHATLLNSLDTPHGDDDNNL